MTTQPFLPYSVAMITPFTPEDNIDAEGVQRMVQYYTRNQVPALLVSGSTGEQHSLSLEEKITLYEAVRDAAPDSMELYAGVAAVRTRDAVRLAKETERIGQTAIMLGFPPYVRPNQREAALYVGQVCSEISLPVMLYNNPLRTGFNLELDTLLSLVKDFPQITALKETGNPDSVEQIKAELGENFQVLSGIDLTITDYFAKGYDGLTSVAGNLYPVELMRIVQLLQEGQFQLAQQALSPLRANLELFGSIGWVRVIRHLFAEHGIVSGIYREPLTPLNSEERALLQGFTLTN